MLSFALPGYTMENWSTVKGNLASGSLGLFHGCVELHSPWTHAGAFGGMVGGGGGRKALPVQCFTLNRHATAMLGFSPRLYGLLKAARIMAALSLGATAVGGGVSALFTLLFLLQCFKVTYVKCQSRGGA